MCRKTVISAAIALACATFAPADEIAPEATRAGLLTRTVRKLLSDSPSAGGRVRVGPLVPRIVVISTGGGLAPMLHFWAPDIGGTAVDVHGVAAYSTRHYQYYDLRVGRLPHVGGSRPGVERGTSRLFPLADLERTAAAPGFAVWASARYRDYPGEDSYGVGPSSSLDHRTDYRLRDETYEGIGQLRRGRLTLTGRGGLMRTWIGAGRDSAHTDTVAVDDEVSAPGLLRAPDFVRLAAGLWLEARDQPANPHRGLAVGLALSRFDDRGGAAFQWTRLSIDARQYLSLGSRRHVVALRQVASLDDPDAGSRVPFSLQATLGGGGLLRGYRSFRFRDDKLLALAAEYRFELHPKVELALIGEAGQVSGAVADFALGLLRHSFGAGVRLKSPHHVRLRLDVMHSEEGTRLNLKLGPSF